VCFTDVTEAADWPDRLRYRSRGGRLRQRRLSGPVLAGVYHNTLYHNNATARSPDVTAKAGLDLGKDPDYGPLWAISGAWVDVNNDGLLDLFVLNYLQWHYSDQPCAAFLGTPDYCHPRYYKGQPIPCSSTRAPARSRMFPAQWGIRQHVGKGMGVGVADYDQDGRPDLFVTNDAYYNSLFHNLGDKFEEVAMAAGVALARTATHLGMGRRFSRRQQRRYPDIAFIALNNQTSRCS